ncbi:MAG: hypothetical protein MZV63_50315 [Marinilabiliales bacterium]|nr:hypothetical protein [Marinilabiliales bacterium]
MLAKTERDRFMEELDAPLPAVRLAP